MLDMSLRSERLTSRAIYEAKGGRSGVAQVLGPRFDPSLAGAEQGMNETACWE